MGIEDEGVCRDGEEELCEVRKFVKDVTENGSLSKVKSCDLYREWERRGKSIDEHVKTPMQRHVAREIVRIDKETLERALE